MVDINVSEFYDLFWHVDWIDWPKIVDSGKATIFFIVWRLISRKAAEEQRRIE